MNRWIAAFVLAALAAAGCFSGYSTDDPPHTAMKVHRGRFVSEMTLTGELDAARGDVIAVPALPSWQTSIKWIANDGTEVKQGERVVELDNSQFTSNLDGKRQAVAQSEQELQQREAEWTADMLQKKLDVEKKQADHEKAKLEAAVPKDILSSREYEDRQMKLKRTAVELVKAQDVLRSQLTSVRTDRANLVLKLQKAQRELKVADDAIEALILRAPRDGIVVLRDHPWEGRKLKDGDPVFVGLALALLPDPSSLRVAAALADVDDRKVAIGMPADVILDAYPGTTFPGRVSDISAVAQETTNRNSLRRAFRVVIKLDRLDVARMRPGLSARVIIRRAVINDALLVPRAAVDFSKPQPTVKVGSKVTKVKLGACNAAECVILDGLREGEPVGSVAQALLPVLAQTRVSVPHGGGG